jgi:photosystem II stability/assembly factor-like uncharacterized protein
LNSDTGYAFRSHAYLLKTTNGGQSWTESTIGFIGSIYAISFPTINKGFLAGEQGVLYRTENEGTDWSLLSPVDRIFYNDFKSMYFINADIGFLVGTKGRIMKTVDGGTSWKAYSINYNNINGLAFPDAATGYVATGNTVYKTTDSAKNWTILPLSVGTTFNSAFGKAHFFSKDTGLVASTNYAYINKTNDGGQTWRKIYPSGNTSYDNVPGMSFINDSVGFITFLSSGGGSLLTKTKDRGETWTGVDSSHSIGEIHFLNEKTGYALGQNRLFKTSDSGHTWMILLDNGFTTTQGLWFIDERTGLVGSGNGVMRTSDSGHTWIKIPFDNSVDQDAKILMFINASTAFASCSSGLTYQSSDTGLSWGLYGNTPNSIITINKDSLIYFAGGYGGILSSNTSYILPSSATCAGGHLTYVSNIAGADFSWQLDKNDGLGFTTLGNGGVYSGTNTGVLAISYLDRIMRGYKYRCLVDGSKYSKVYELTFESHWTGAVDNYWDNPGNWSCGWVPDISTDVLISSGNIQLRATEVIHSLTIAPGAQLTVVSGSTLVIVK